MYAMHRPASGDGRQHTRGWGGVLCEPHSGQPQCGAGKAEKGTILGEVAEVEEVVSDQTPVAQLHTTGATLPTTQERTRGEVLVGTEDTTPNIDSGGVHGVVSELCEDQGTRVLRALNLPVTHLTSTQQQQLRALLQHHSDVFALDSCEFGTASIVTDVIDTGNHAPIRQPVRRTPFALRAKVDELVADMLDQGVVNPLAAHGL